MFISLGFKSLKLLVIHLFVQLNSNWLVVFAPSDKSSLQMFANSFTQRKDNLHVKVFLNSVLNSAK